MAAQFAMAKRALELKQAQIATAKRALKLQRHGAIDTAPSTDLGTAFRAVLEGLSEEDLKAVSNHIESMDRYWPHPCPQWPHSKHLDTNAYVNVAVERAPANPPNLFGIVYNTEGFPVYYVCRKEGIEEALKERGLPYIPGWQSAFTKELLSPFDECDFVAMQEEKLMAPYPLRAVPAVLSELLPGSETESDDDYPDNEQKTDMARVPEQVHEDAGAAHQDPQTSHSSGGEEEPAYELHVPWRRYTVNLWDRNKIMEAAKTALPEALWEKSKYSSPYFTEVADKHGFNTAVEQLEKEGLKLAHVGRQDKHKPIVYDIIPSNGANPRYLKRIYELQVPFLPDYALFTEHLWDREKIMEAAKTVLPEALWEKSKYSSPYFTEVADKHGFETAVEQLKKVGLKLEHVARQDSLRPTSVYYIMPSDDADPRYRMQTAYELHVDDNEGYAQHTEYRNLPWQWDSERIKAAAQTALSGATWKERQFSRYTELSGDAAFRCAEQLLHGMRLVLHYRAPDYDQFHQPEVYLIVPEKKQDIHYLAPEDAEQKTQVQECVNNIVDQVQELAEQRVHEDAGAAHQEPQTRTQTPARRKLQEVDEELRNAKQNVQAACAELDVGQRNYERYEEARRACKQPEADEQEVLEKLEIVRAEEEICKSQILAIQRQCKADLLAMQRKLAKIRREKESFEEAADWAAVSRELAQNNARNCSSPPPVREQEALKRAEQERMRLEGQQRRMEHLVQHEGSTPFDEHQVLAVLEDDGGDEPGAGGSEESEESEEESEEPEEESEEPEAEPEGDITAECLGKIVYLTGHAHAHTHSHTQICSSNFNNSQAGFSTKTTDARRRKRRNKKVADSPST